MIEIQSSTDIDTLTALKTEYLGQSIAPLDGMWLCGFLPLAKHFSFHLNAAAIGYCCINDDGQLLQFYLRDNNHLDGSQLLAEIVDGKHPELPEILGAYVSTAEPQFLSQCFDNFHHFKVNAKMYQFKKTPVAVDGHGCILKTMTHGDLSTAVTFAHHNIGAPEDWLKQYYANLIQRQELFGCWRDNQLVGTGENRVFDDVQHGYTDLGVIVETQQRKQGLATWILQQLAQQAVNAGLKPICSTEHGNLGAQKAITRAGFSSQHRIIHFSG